MYYSSWFVLEVSVANYIANQNKTPISYSIPFKELPQGSVCGPPHRLVKNKAGLWEAITDDLTSLNTNSREEPDELPEM